MAGVRLPSKGQAWAEEGTEASGSLVARGALEGSPGRGTFGARLELQRVEAGISLLCSAPREQTP